MDNHWSQKFYDEFPTFFNKVSPPVRGGFWGFECGPGWEKLLYKLCKGIQEIAEDGFQVLQIKEKFGTLRFYAFNYGEDIQKLIAKAENESSRTCEDCGEVGSMRGSGWLRTLCNSCDEKKRK